MFERKFVDSVSAENIEIGFPGEIIHKDFKIKTVDLSQLPSLVASEKIRQLMAMHKSSKNKGSTTVIARLTHTAVRIRQTLRKPVAGGTAEGIGRDSIQASERGQTLPVREQYGTYAAGRLKSGRGHT